MVECLFQSVQYLKHKLHKHTENPAVLLSRENTAASKFEVITTVSLPHPPPSDLSPNSTPYFLISQIMQIGKDSWGNQPGCCAE